MNRQTDLAAGVRELDQTQDKEGVLHISNVLRHYPGPCLVQPGWKVEGKEWKHSIPWHLSHL